MDSGVAFCNPLIPVPARNQPIRHLASSLYNFRLVIQSTLLKSPEKFWNSTFHISGLFSGVGVRFNKSRHLHFNKSRHLHPELRIPRPREKSWGQDRGVAGAVQAVVCLAPALLFFSQLSDKNITVPRSALRA